MPRLSHETYSLVFHVVFLGLMTNVLLALGCLPAVVLLMTTDPAESWPLLAITLPLTAPAVAAAFTVFREHDRGGLGVLAAFLAGARATGRKALAVGVLAGAVLTVLLADVRVLAGTDLGVVLVPLLLLLAVLTLTSTLLSLAGIAEVPQARLRDVLGAALVLGVRRWHLSAVSLLVLALQVALFTTSPALAIGITASAALYLVWANARFTLRPVLDTAEAPVR